MLTEAAEVYDKVFKDLTITSSHKMKTESL